MASNLVNRLAYQEIKEIYKSNEMGHLPLTESSLTLVKDCSSTVAQYQFDLLNTEGSPKSWEVRLSQSDSFWITSWALYLGFGSASDTDETELYTYPAEIFSSAFQDYYTVYNSTLNVSVNNDRILQDYDTHKFLYIPSTQRLSSSANQNFNETGGVNDITQYLASYIQLNGAKKNIISLDMPGSIAAPESNSFVVLKLFGIVCIGGSIFNTYSN